MTIAKLKPRKNLEGQTFVRLKVTKNYKQINGVYYWRCLCECGKEHWVRRDSLVSGQTKSCGCLRGRKVVNYTGLVFGKLTVKDTYKRDKNKKETKWLCICECGNECWVTNCSLKSGTKSCGCARLGQNKIKFGRSTKNIVYKRYIKGAKKRNLDFSLTFEEFIVIIQKECYYCNDIKTSVQKSKNNNGDFSYTGIDRVDNQKGYTIENCAPCCRPCNYMKHKMSLNEFLDKIKTIYKRRINE